MTLKITPKGVAIDLSCDRFSVTLQEISFLEEEHFTEAFNKTLSEVKEKIQDPNLWKIFWRAHIAASLLSQCKPAASTKINYVECGTHLGVITRFLINYLNPKINCFLFDTWNGIPVDQFAEDEPLGSWHNKNNYTEDVYEYMAKIFSQYPQVTMIRGKVPDTLGQYPNSTVNFLHLDMNIVYPEAEALNFFWPKMPPGSCILMDDYGFANHTKQRLMYDKFFGELDIHPCQLPTGQAFVFKN